MGIIVLLLLYIEWWNVAEEKSLGGLTKLILISSQNFTMTEGSTRLLVLWITSQITGYLHDQPVKNHILLGV